MTAASKPTGPAAPDRLPRQGCPRCSRTLLHQYRVAGAYVVFSCAECPSPEGGPLTFAIDIGCAVTYLHDLPDFRPVPPAVPRPVRPLRA